MNQEDSCDEDRQHHDDEHTANEQQVDYDLNSEKSSDQYSVEALDVESDPNCDPLTLPLRHDDATGSSSLNTTRDETAAGCSQKTNLSFCGSFFKRRFVGETSGSLITSQILYGNTVEEIIQAVWTIVKPIICREVLFIEDDGNQTPVWADTEPTFQDMRKFVYMQNKNRRRINIDQIDSKLLISWRMVDIRVHVHIYSTAVSCKQLWDLVDKKLVRFQDTDRAGAPNNQSVSALVNELRELHGGQFTGHASSWRLWANFIHTAPAHERKRRMSELPPHSIIKFFRSVPISEAVQLESTRSGLTVANTINEAFSTELDGLDEDADQMIALGHRMKHRVSAIRTRISINASLVSAMQESIRPEESGISRSLADSVSDMQDIDHS